MVRQARGDPGHRGHDVTSTTPGSTPIGGAHEGDGHGQRVDAHSAEVEPRTLLVHYLRDDLGLTGTNVGCDTSSCGACTVHLDGESVKSCTVLAVQADGSEVTTIEGLADGRRAAPDAGGVPAVPRPPVRLLHAGHGDGRGRRSSTRTRTPTEAGGARSGSRATSAAAPATRTSSQVGAGLCRPTDRLDRRGAGMTATEPRHRGRAAAPRRHRHPHAPPRGPGRCSPARPASPTTSHIPGALHLAHRAQPVRPRPHHLDRHVGGAGDARRRRRVHRRRPADAVGRPDAVRVAGHRGHEEPAALPARHRQGALRRRRRGRRARRDRRARPATRSRPSTSTTSRCRRWSTSRTP